MTEEQQKVKDDVIRKVKELLGEHFEAYMLMAETEDPEDPDNGTLSRLHWHGGFNNAWGLAARAVHRFELISKGDVDDNEDD